MRFQRKKGVNPFLTMMSRETRAQLDFETEPYKCPKCRNERFESGWALHSHWGQIHEGVMPEVKPSARKGSILKPSLSKVAPAKKALHEKINPRTQRKNAANAPKQSFKELPEGWTREKVASKYYAAPSKTIFLKKWGEKYPNFKLSMQKANEWEKLFIHSESESE